MYSFGMNKVINNLQTGAVSSLEQLVCYIVSGGIAIPIVDILHRAGSIFGGYTRFFKTQPVVAYTIILIILGLAFLNLYRINRNRDDKDFALRLIVLQATIGARLVLCMVPIVLVLRAFQYCSTWASEGVVPEAVGMCCGEKFSYLLFVSYHAEITVLIFTVIYYGLISWAFTKIANKKQA